MKLKYIAMAMVMLPVACAPAHAEQDCKYTKTVNQSGGEIVSSTTNYDCNTPPKVIIKEVPKVVYKTVQPTTRVISTRVVSSTPVYHNPPQQNNNLIGQILGSVINYNSRVAVTGSVNIGGVSVGFSKKKGCRPAPNGKKGWYCD